MDDLAYLTLDEAAALLGVSRETVRRRVLVGALPGLRITRDLWRVERAALVAAAPDAPGPLTAVLDLQTVAQRLRCGRRTVERLVAVGQLRSQVAEGRRVVTRAALLDWLDDRAAELLQDDPPTCRPARRS